MTHPFSSAQITYKILTHQNNSIKWIHQLAGHSVGIDQQLWHDANHNLGVILMYQGKYKNAKRAFENTLDFYTKSKTYQKIASVYEDLGTLAFLLNDFVGALAHCHQGLTNLEQYGHHPILYVRLLCLKYRILQNEKPELARELLPIIKVLAQAHSLDLGNILYTQLQHCSLQ